MLQSRRGRCRLGAVLEVKRRLRMKSISRVLLGLTLLVVGPASAQKVRPISANGRPLAFQIARASVTRDPQSSEQVHAMLSGVDLQAASGQRGYHGGTIKEELSYQQMPLGPSESFLIIEFAVSNVKHALRLSTNDVQLID